MYVCDIGIDLDLIDELGSTKQRTFSTPHLKTSQETEDEGMSGGNGSKFPFNVFPFQKAPGLATTYMFYLFFQEEEIKLKPVIAFDCGKASYFIFV